MIVILPARPGVQREAGAAATRPGGYSATERGPSESPRGASRGQLA